MGKRNFELERFDLALSLFEIALRGSQTNEKKLNCRRAIGAAAFKLQDFPRAHNELTAAKKLAGDEVLFELNLNLAAVNMSLGFYENALELLNLSESELTEEETYELQFNRFVSLMRLNRQEEVSALYAAIADDILARDVDPTKFSNLLAWSLIQQDPEVWLALRSKLEDALSEQNHEILFEPGEPSRLLFRAYDEEWQALGIEDTGTQRWRVVKQLWPAFDAKKECAKSCRRN